MLREQVLDDVRLDVIFDPVENRCERCRGHPADKVRPHLLVEVLEYVGGLLPGQGGQQPFDDVCVELFEEVGLVGRVTGDQEGDGFRRAILSDQVADDLDDVFQVLF